MKRINVVLVMLLSITMVSFVSIKPPKKVNTGTYGVCSCGKDGIPHIRLVINEDQTFHYYNVTDPSKKIDVTGNWVLDGNTIVLKNYKSDYPIHNRWKMDDKCLRSRLGMNFTRLCNTAECK